MTFLELESSLNLNQTLIDGIIRNMKINNNVSVLTKSSFNSELNKLNKQRDKIIDKIKAKLDESFPI